MPIEIRELVIRAAVNSGGSSSGKKSSGKKINTSDIVQDSIKEVAEMMKKEKER
jgi:hypothetical protein